MAAFEISRIHTHRGIFKISGEWQPQGTEGSPVLESVGELEMMGTDGWLALKLEDDSVKALVTELTPVLLFHLSHQD
ncbi:hypothetical protein L2750_19890 [Shewanella submarina]|uniref:Uncharacterized protein n=1 Tax=Shewanella submarina TaxID=2016376 RepID=A0ABV7G6D9_9GAMM|nr:hypothetical protein [Shewanella submarina]MCL1039388.1 hypothetical protein [Shewanella submarina]